MGFGRKEVRETVPVQKMAKGISEKFQNPLDKAGKIC